MLSAFLLFCTRDPNRSPGVRSLDEWPLHSPGGKQYLELNAKFLRNADKSAAVGRGPRIQECAFWNHYLPPLVEATSMYSVISGMCFVFDNSM